MTASRLICIGLCSALILGCSSRDSDQTDDILIDGGTASSDTLMQRVIDIDLEFSYWRYSQFMSLYAIEDHVSVSVSAGAASTNAELLEKQRRALPELEKLVASSSEEHEQAIAEWRTMQIEGLNHLQRGLGRPPIEDTASLEIAELINLQARALEELDAEQRRIEELRNRREAEH